MKFGKNLRLSLKMKKSLENKGFEGALMDFLAIFSIKMRFFLHFAKKYAIIEDRYIINNIRKP